MKRRSESKWFFYRIWEVLHKPARKIIITNSPFCLNQIDESPLTMEPTHLWMQFHDVILLIRDMVVESWNRQHHSQTIHPTKKFTSMNLFKILWVVTWAWSFLTSVTLQIRKYIRNNNNKTLADSGLFLDF